MNGCCALGTCTDPDCYLCTTVAQLEQPTWTKDKQSKFATPDPNKKRRPRDPVFTKRNRKALTK